LVLINKICDSSIVLIDKIKNAPLPDIIISTDLEAFENNKIFSKLKDTLYPLQRYLTIDFCNLSS